MNADQRPIVFLDVDGTLLPFGNPSVTAPDSEPAGLADPSHPLLSRIDRRLGPLLMGLDCELMWATTWMDDANDVISPLLGLPRLRVVEPLDDEDDQRAGGVQWKTRSIVRQSAGRTFVWIDDVIGPADEWWIELEHPGRALAHRVEPAVGLTAPGIADIAAWLTERGQ